MFQLKSRVSNEEVNPTNVNPNTALPNSYGKIRTLKEDYEEFKTGKVKNEPVPSNNIPVPTEATPPAAPDPLPKPETPTSQLKIEISNPPEKKIEEQTLTTNKEKTKTAKDEALSPFGSQTFFNNKSPFEEETKSAPPEKPAEEGEQKGNPKKTLIIILSLLLILAIAGGGFYYYWFFVKKLPSQDETSTSTQAVENPTAQPGVQPENKNLRYLNISVDSSKEENQKVLQGFAENFLTSASENDVIEIKIIGRDNNALKPEDLETSLGFTLPASLVNNFNDDYSFFMKKENSEIRMGAAFKLSSVEGLSEDLKNQEKDLPLDLTPFYLNQVPSGAVISFNSSRYKNADIRYFNFPDPPNTSLDYSIITDKQNSYFIFATSKYSIRSILDYMSEK